MSVYEAKPWFDQAKSDLRTATALRTAPSPMIFDDVGCGNGTYSEILIGEAEHLTATDFSDEMVTSSKERLKDLGNVTVEKADCFDLPYSDCSFDTIFMANLLHVIPEPHSSFDVAY